MGIRLNGSMLGKGMARWRAAGLMRKRSLQGRVNNPSSQNVATPGPDDGLRTSSPTAIQQAAKAIVYALHSSTILARR